MGNSNSTIQLLRELKRKAIKSFLKVSTGELAAIMTLILNTGECLYFQFSRLLANWKSPVRLHCLSGTSFGYLLFLRLRLPFSSLGRSRLILGRMSVDWRQRQSHQGCRRAHVPGSVGRWEDMVATFTLLSGLLGEQPSLRRGSGGVQMALESAARGSCHQHSMLHSFSYSWRLARLFPWEGDSRNSKCMEKIWVTSL